MFPTALADRRCGFRRKLHFLAALPPSGNRASFLEKGKQEKRRKNSKKGKKRKKKREKKRQSNSVTDRSVPRTRTRTTPALAPPPSLYRSIYIMPLGPTTGSGQLRHHRQYRRHNEDRHREHGGEREDGDTYTHPSPPSSPCPSLPRTAVCGGTPNSLHGTIHDTEHLLHTHMHINIHTKAAYRIRASKHEYVLVYSMDGRM